MVMLLPLPLTSGTIATSSVKRFQRHDRPILREPVRVIYLLGLFPDLLKRHVTDGNEKK